MSLRKRNQPDEQSNSLPSDRRCRERLSLSPLTVEDALRGAMQTGKPPERPKRERPAAKRGPKKGDKTAKAVVATLLLASGLLAPAIGRAEDQFDALLKAMERVEKERRLDCPECFAYEDEQKRREAAFIAARDEVAQKAGREPGTIRLGDTAEYVESQWGNPARADRTISANGVTEWWHYKGSNAVHFANGVVESIHVSR